MTARERPQLFTRRVRDVGTAGRAKGQRRLLPRSFRGRRIENGVPVRRGLSDGLTVAVQADAVDSATLSGVLDSGQEVVERVIGSYGIAGGIEVDGQAADEGEHDGGQLGPAEAAHALLERREPVGGRGLPEARPEWFAGG